MLEIKNINKTFKDKQAVHDLSFDLEEGSILGLIGQNGAGKSTTFRMILDFIKPTSGKILWNQHTISAADRSKIGFMPEERGLYQNESIESQMLYFADLHGMKHRELKIKLAEWMKKLEVVGKPSSKISSLSKGNAQKVQLIAVLIFKPELIILDEPFSGLDPVNADLLIQEIINLRNQGSMIIFSSHNMTNVDELSDHILMLHHGETLLNADIKDIYQDFNRLNLKIDGYDNVSQLKYFPGVDSLEFDTKGVAHLKLKNEQVGPQIFKAIAESGSVYTFDQQYPSLDDIFRMKVNQANQKG